MNSERLTPEQVARLDPFGVRKIPASKELEELLGENQEEPRIRGVETRKPIVERAREILGRDFLGVEATRKLGQELRKVGIRVDFNIFLPSFPYTEADLQIAKENGEMLVLRQEGMQKNGKDLPITLIEFRELFRRDPLGKIETLFYSFRPDNYDWYKEEKFAAQKVVDGVEQISLGWSLVKKNILEGSLNKSWDKQEELLRQYETELKAKGAQNTSVRRRTAMEVVYDELLYYVNTSERLLDYRCDWTQTYSHLAHPVWVGFFGSGGLRIASGSSTSLFPIVGVCPSR